MSNIINNARFALPGLLIIGVMMVSLFLGCGKENKLAGGDGLNVSIPQIDKVIPAKIETATFALG